MKQTKRFKAQKLSKSNSWTVNASLLIMGVCKTEI